MTDAQYIITIVLENLTSLYGRENHLAFDQKVAQEEGANPDWEGVQIEPVAWLQDGFLAVSRVNNNRGRIYFAATLLNPALPVNGDRTVAGITFRAKKTGVSVVSIESAILSTCQAEAIPFTAQIGSIEVNPSGQAPDVSLITGPVEPSTSTGHTGRLILAGLSILAFLISLGIFIYALRRRR